MMVVRNVTSADTSPRVCWYTLSTFATTFSSCHENTNVFPSSSTSGMLTAIHLLVDRIYGRFIGLLYRWGYLAWCDVVRFKVDVLLLFKQSDLSLFEVISSRRFSKRAFLASFI
jgi:hypothetical protein